MKTIEDRLRALTPIPPREELRGRVLAAARPRPPEWKRLLHTLEGCAAALLVVFLGCAWFEQDTEALRRGLRVAPPEVQREAIARRAAEVSAWMAAPELREYLAARWTVEYDRPYVVRATL